MITQQQVYNYLQENNIKLGGTFDPVRKSYKPRFGLPFNVNFVDKPYLEIRITDDYVVGYCDGFDIDVAAQGTLDEISKTFLHETYHTNIRAVNVWRDIGIATVSLSLIMAGLYDTVLGYLPSIAGLSMLGGLYFVWNSDEKKEESYIKGKVIDVLRK